MGFRRGLGMRAREGEGRRVFTMGMLGDGTVGGLGFGDWVSLVF